jgi:putative ABC transport system permease protein
MHFGLAQQLLYGRGEHQAVGIVLQLQRTEDIAPARARLVLLFKNHGLDLEVRDFAELVPFYAQVIGMFGAIFVFIAVIMGVIVLFAVVNTMSMSVMERTNEIGTARAMGVRRRGIRRQFVIEGWMLGAIGATAGLLLAFIIAVLVNRSGMTWMPPGQAAPVPLRVMASGVVLLQGGVWLGLVLMATLAALIPANRGARLPVVDALRHV